MVFIKLGKKKATFKGLSSSVPSENYVARKGFDTERENILGNVSSTTQ